MKHDDMARFINVVQSIVKTEIQNAGLYLGQWHNGTVEEVISPSRLRVFVDGSMTSQQVPCNPDVLFKSGDKVFVLFVNGDTKNKFIPFKRGIEVAGEVVIP